VYPYKYKVEFLHAKQRIYALFRECLTAISKKVNHGGGAHYTLQAQRMRGDEEERGSQGP
jgi:hypothetical protein